MHWFRETLVLLQVLRSVVLGDLDVVDPVVLLNILALDEQLGSLGSSGSGKTTGSSGSASGGSRSTVSAGVPYTAALLRSQGKSEVAITSALRQEGYTPAQIAKILQEMNK